MKFFTICFFLFSCVVSARDFSLMTGWEKLAEHNACPTIDAEGVVMGVNVVTGSYHESALDFISKGIDPIRIERSYFRENGRTELYADLDAPNALGWYLNFENILFVDDIMAEDACNALFSHPSGSLIHFQKSRMTNKFCCHNFKGFMNDTASFLSGQTHLRNAYIFTPSRKGYEVHLPDGSILYFQMPKNMVGAPAQANLIYKKNPSGSVVSFENGKFVTKAPDGTILNWLKMIYEGMFLSKIETSDGQTFQLTRSKGRHFRASGSEIFLLDGFIYPDGSSVKYSYKDHVSKGTDFLTCKQKSQGSYLYVHYRQYDQKVECLEGPYGQNGEKTALYRFCYGEGFTDVYDAKGNKTRYEFDKENRITRILKYDGNTLVRIEKNVWDTYGCLLAKVLMGPDGKPFLARSFEYDARGNVLRESLHGKLTGISSIPLELDSKGIPRNNGVESYSKRYTYYPNDFNLLATETDGSSTTEYSYVPNTNLLASKLVFDEHKKLRLRQFRFYDSMGALCTVIEDDGNSKECSSVEGCSLRKIKRISNRRAFPGVGQPECLEEKYLDLKTREEKLLKKVIYHYDAHNDPTQEEIYDAAGNFVYAIKRRYDLMGRCVSETDALGNEMFCCYDSNGNLVKKTGPRPDVELEYGYDLANRKIWTKQKDERGKNKTTHLRYDAAGNCIAEVDEFGNEKIFIYDGLKRRTKEIYPSTLNKEDSLRKVETKVIYDLLDHVTASTDEEGNQVFIEYNIRGQPLKIKTLFVTGKVSEESFEYDLKGNCVTKCLTNGTKTHFVYDFLDRVIVLRNVDEKGNILNETSAQYNAFSPVRTKDGEGVETTIEYDEAGREKKVTKSTLCIEKGYDALGFLASQKEWHNASEYLLKRLKHDFKGQLIEETCEEADKMYAKKTYAYDALGNRIKIVSYSKDDLPEEISIFYDAFGREIKKTDPLGHEWSTEFSETTNKWGQLSLYKKTCDPDGNREESFYDARGRIEKVVKTSQDGKEIFEKELRYDGLSNLVLAKENGVETQFFYEGKNQIRILEEANQEKPRETKFKYDASGRLIQKETLKVMHEFVYDGLGRVHLHHAYDKTSNQRIKISYEYDRNGKPLKIIQNGKETLRSYDENGRLIAETQESGLSVTYNYDRLGRRLAMSLPDGMSLAYTYAGPFLFSVARLDASHNPLYVHHYLERDLSGRVTTSQLIDNKKTTYEYDLSGRILSLQGNGFGQRVNYDSLGNLTEMVTHDYLGITTEHFSYTSRNQIAKENGLEHTYDAQENRLDGKIGHFNQLVSAIGCSFIWNEDGYLTQATGEEEFSCEYDPLGRMTTFQNTTYIYDGLNRRIKKNGTIFLYDGVNEIGICKENGEFVEFRLLGEGKGAEMGSTIAIEMGKKIYSIIHDVRGNIVFLSELGGKNWECYRYTAFGESQVFSNSREETHNPWRFCGKRLDEESGFIFFGRRYYMPKIGRWIAPDPLGFADGSNLYAFVHNNPMTHFDLYGLYDEEFSRPRNFVDFCCRTYHFLMSTIEWIGKNLIPIPGIRDLIEDFGRGMGGGKFLDQPEYLQSTTQIHLVDGKKIEGHSYVWINGIRTTYAQAQAIGEEFSKKMEGVQVYVIYNATNGLLSDFLECFALKYGMISAPERKILECIRTILSDSPNEMIHIQAHSQGGLHLYNAARLMSENEREHIKVNTFGSAKIIPEGIFKRTHNYISSYDVVPIFDTFNYIKARFGRTNNVTFLKSTSFSPLTEHFIMGSTYQKSIESISDKLITGEQ